MSYGHVSTDNLHGDEPEIDALASRAEAMRDVDAEIDRKQAMMDAEDANRKSNERLLLQYQASLTFMIDGLSNLLRVSLSVTNIPPHSADHLVLQAERIQSLLRQMSK